jgi:glycosyltransferase involved in cell wall biosynthesis
MDRLTIGIFQEPHLDKKTGGGYSYYHALIEAIDKFQFHESLDIRFIQNGASEPGSHLKRIVRIDPYKDIKKKIRYGHYFNHSIIKATKRFFGPIEKIYNWYEGVFDHALQKSVEEELAKNKIDLVYYLHPRPHKLNYPYVCTHWDNGHKSMFAFPEVAMNNSYDDREDYFHSVLGKAFAVYCESESGRKELLHYTSLNEERVYVVPLFPGNVVTYNISTAAQELNLKKYGIAKSQFFFYPAQFWSHKNHYNLLMAFSTLNKSHPSIKLLFTGADKGNKEYINEVVVALGLEKQVVMPGFVTNEEVYSYYKNALALVMPTFLGPSNMPLLEAEALGCPVICTDLPGHREMLGEGAYYVQPDDPLSICSGLEAHIHPREHLPRTNSVFNLENAVKQIEANFLKLKARRKTFGYQFKEL